MHRRLTHFLLAFLLLCAQALVATHAVEHAATEGQAPTHACELCLAAHVLGSALPTAAIALLLLAACHVLYSVQRSGRGFLPALDPRQQAPPLL